MSELEEKGYQFEKPNERKVDEKSRIFYNSLNAMYRDALFLSEESINVEQKQEQSIRAKTLKEVKELFNQIHKP